MFLGLVVLFVVSSTCEPKWIDFLADTGDGFGSTLTVVATLSQPFLNVSRAASIEVDILWRLLRGQSKPYGSAKPTGEYFVTGSGSHVIIGGDLMYPEPSLKGWKQNFVLPFTFARSRFNCSLELKSAIRDGKPQMVEWLHSDRVWTYVLEIVTETRGCVQQVA